jgi:hypothetical protein
MRDSEKNLTHLQRVLLFKDSREGIAARKCEKHSGSLVELISRQGLMDCSRHNLSRTMTFFQKPTHNFEKVVSF